MLRIRCRLNKLLVDRQTSPEELAKASGLSVGRVVEYCDETIDAVSLLEIGAMLSALGCDNLSDMFEPISVDQAQAQDEPDLIFEEDWETPCASAPDGKHVWYRDVTASSSVYQEYYCSACKHRYSFIL